MIEQRADGLNDNVLSLRIRTVKSGGFVPGGIPLHIEDASGIPYSVGFGGFTTVHAFAPVTFTGRR
jgi:hypothetical protein